MADNVEFHIKIKSTGDMFLVPNDRSILDILYENGIEHPFQCRAGMCSECVTTYLEGTVDHRDLLMEDDIDYDTQLTICQSRATSPLLVLDL